MKYLLPALILTFFYNFPSRLKAEVASDSLAIFRIDTLSELKITAYRDRILSPVPEKLDMVLISSKKTSLINLTEVDANLVQNTARQVFARTPGVFVFESDGSGVQMGIAVRGLSPNRSWEFNVRQNGYDIAADPFGYPEAYYSPSLESVDQVQLIRGAASLQFGPQFGGLLNYKMKKGDSKKRIAIESMQTVGSYGLFNTYNSIGGQLSRWNYFISFHHRQADGWRDNSSYRTGQLYARLAYQPSTKLEVALEATVLRNSLQQPGGLTDSLFKLDPSQSLRSRNWFSTPWNTINLSFDWKYSERLRLAWNTTVLSAERSSVGVVSSITTPDTIYSATGDFSSRQVDRDYYLNLTSELRVNYDYNLFDQPHVLAAGIRYFQGTIDRKQKGNGTTGSTMDFNLTSSPADFPKLLAYGTINKAVFAENAFHLNSKITITPGIRLESLRSTSEGQLGVINDVAQEIIPENLSRTFLLTGVGADWKYNEASKVYFNLVQSYRPVTYSELTPAATTDVIDPSLKDASGYNADIGNKGKLGEWFSYDVSLFYLMYNNRIGSVTIQRDDLSVYQYKTNLGSSRHRGVEAYIEAHPFRLNCPESFLCGWSFWASATYTKANYVDYAFINTTGNQATFVDLSGKQVEYAPAVIARYGLTITNQTLSATLQGSYTSSVFTDANNTVTATSNGQSGELPAYTVYDFSAQYALKTNYIFKVAVNNLFNVHYATRRSGGYPGPGLLPNEGRTVLLTVGVRF